jgi:pimeloyl-ACP methyl ester carboxylesterase
VSLLEIQGNKFYVVHEGDGPPLVFLHGFPLSHGMWKYQRAEFKATHRVIIPDLRGFGKSIAAADPMSLDDYADDLAAILDRLHVGKPVVLCGLSMGGYIAFRFVERHSDRLRALILCDTKAVADSREATANRTAMADRVLTEGPRIAVEAMLPRLFDAEAKNREPALIDEIRDGILASSSRTIAAAQRAMAIRPDSTPLLRQIAVPTLVLVGEHDVLSPPAEMQALASEIPGSEFVVIPHAGHLAPLEQPAAVNAAIQAFLERIAE